MSSSNVRLSDEFQDKINELQNPEPLIEKSVEESVRNRTRDKSGSERSSVSSSEDKQKEKLLALPIEPPFIIPDEEFQQIQRDYYIMKRSGNHSL